MFASLRAQQQFPTRLDEKAASNRITAQLRAAERKDGQTVRVLVVGSRQSGKSTLISTFDRLFGSREIPPCSVDEVNAYFFHTLGKAALNEPWADAVQPLFGDAQSHKHNSLGDASCAKELKCLVRFFLI